jgi:hypothetical protein
MALISAVDVSSATAMGRRAGEAFKETGQPTRNPFTDAKHPGLAAAWRRAYLAASKMG